MSVSKWAYKPEVCDGDYCPGDCNHCIKNEMEGENINISERMERLAERRAEAFRKLSKRYNAVAEIIAQDICGELGLKDLGYKAISIFGNTLLLSGFGKDMYDFIRILDEYELKDGVSEYCGPYVEVNGKYKGVNVTASFYKH